MTSQAASSLLALSNVGNMFGKMVYTGWTRDANPLSQLQLRYMPNCQSEVEKLSQNDGRPNVPRHDVMTSRHQGAP